MAGDAVSPRGPPGPEGLWPGRPTVVPDALGRARASPLSCSMKHTFPLVLKAKVSGVMHSVWKRAACATLRMARQHSRHTAQASRSPRPRSRRDRMSARDTFSCQHRGG